MKWRGTNPSFPQVVAMVVAYPALAVAPMVVARWAVTAVAAMVAARMAATMAAATAATGRRIPHADSPSSCLPRGFAAAALRG